MSTWKLVYDNAFPRSAVGTGRVIDLYRASEGEQIARSRFVTGRPLPGLLAGDGRGFTYRLRTPLRKIIGVDATIGLALGAAIRSPLTLLATTDGQVSVALAAPSTDAPPESQRLVVRVGDVVTTVRSALAVHGQSALERNAKYEVVRVRWTTNGQLHIWHANQLIGYEPEVSPGSHFQADGFVVGDPQRSGNPSFKAVVRQVRLIELREDSAVDELGRQLNPERITELPKRCGPAIQFELQRVLRATRQLMAAFTASQTASWRASDDSGEPFTKTAKAVHLAGSRAGRALSQYLREPTSEARQETLNQLSELLTVLAADQPTLFSEVLAMAAEARAALDEHCADAANEVRAANPRVFAKLDPLAADVEKVMDALVGGHDA